MSSDPTALDQARIVAYVDGELSAEERERFEDELSHNESLRDELESFLRLDVLERHFHAHVAKDETESPAPDASPSARRLHIVRWLPLAAAAALLLVLAWTRFRPDAGGSLHVRVASNAEDVFDTNRSPDLSAEHLHLGFVAPDEGFARIFGQDDLGRWYALRTGTLIREAAVQSGPQRFGSFDRTWIDEQGEQRTYRAFVLLFSKAPLASDEVAEALSHLEGATAEDVRNALEEAFDVQTGSVVLGSN